MNDLPHNTNFTHANVQPHVSTLSIQRSWDPVLVKYYQILVKYINGVEILVLSRYDLVLKSKLRKLL